MSGREVVAVRLLGGLGNQMFQYAAGRALALRRGAALWLDVSSYEAQGPGVTPRRYELDAFLVAARIGLPEENPATASPSLLGRLFGRGAPAAAVPTPLYREPHFAFDPALAAQPTPVLLEGYWQSERYFADAADVIRRELTPREPMDPENAAMAAQIEGVEAVSVHVRRGDYVTNAGANAFHGLCSLDYYQAAVGLIRERVQAPHLFVFSDDHAWTRDHLAFDLPTTYVVANPPDRGFRDMELMARCRHHVVANSSFSWWGAWLNPRVDKTVVAPKNWFADPDVDTRDLIPSNWTRL